jgi:uncharacterized protein YdcH (DUF465 family)
MSYILQADYDIITYAADVLKSPKSENARFMTLAGRFEPIDDAIEKSETGFMTAIDNRLEDLEKRRLAIKDEIAALISAQSAH